MPRKNLKLEEETFEQLAEKKGKYQTWDGFILRDVLPALEARESAEAADD
jgi:hypothetical protein